MEIGVFQGVGQFGQKFQVEEGDISYQPCARWGHWMPYNFAADIFAQRNTVAEQTFFETDPLLYEKRPLYVFERPFLGGDL